ncbi:MULTISPECIES: hypothetical protein, partial [unclassified Microcoleus]|uniref:hypothetical protein n=1 Tax=unclassified Microcoleus TaxID=2642155 RepID=UPI00260128A6
HTRTFQRQAQTMLYSADAQATSRLKRSQMGSISQRRYFLPTAMFCRPSAATRKPSAVVTAF